MTKEEFASIQLEDEISVKDPFIRVQRDSYTVIDILSDSHGKAYAVRLASYPDKWLYIEECSRCSFHGERAKNSESPFYKMGVKIANDAFNKALEDIKKENEKTY